MKNGNDGNRTQKDLDIARMSALKSATELLSSFPDLVSTGSDLETVSRTTVRVADFFLKWIQDAKQPEAGKPGSGAPDPPGASGNGKGNGDRPNNNAKGLERLAAESGFEKRGAYSIPGNDMPISGKQFGFAVTLYRKLGVDHDPEFLNSLTAKQASYHIDELKWRIEHPDGGNQS